MKFAPLIPSCSNENFCFHLGDYSFGFNGKELDKEGMGGGAATYDYGFRIYNSALAKFLSVDPLKKDYPWYTPYQFAGNKPIWAIDLDGLEEFIRTDYFNSTGQLYRTEIQVVARGDIAGQIVHQCNVAVDNFGNAAINYVGTQYGNFLPGGVGSNLLRPAENAAIWNIVQTPGTFAPPANAAIAPGAAPGALFQRTRPDNINGEIFSCSIFAPGGGLAIAGGVAGSTEYGCAEIPSMNGDPDYSGMYVFVNAALVPRNEPYTPAGFNTVPQNPLNRIDPSTGQTFGVGITNAIANGTGPLPNGGGYDLKSESMTTQGCVLSGNNDNTTSSDPTNPTINVPIRAAVGTGNPSTPPPIGTVTLN